MKETHSFAPSFNLRRANVRRANLRCASGDPPSLGMRLICGGVTTGHSRARQNLGEITISSVSIYITFNEARSNQFMVVALNVPQLTQASFLQKNLILTKSELVANVTLNCWIFSPRPGPTNLYEVPKQVWKSYKLEASAD